MANDNSVYVNVLQYLIRLLQHSTQNAVKIENQTNVCVGIISP